MTDFQFFLFQYFLPLILACSFIESIFLHFQSKFDWSAMLVSLSDLFGRLCLQYFLPLTIATPVLNWAENHKFINIALDGWVTLLVLFIAQDFCYYWMHRITHRVRWFWCNHAVHHSTMELNLTAAYRLGMFGKQTGTLLFFVPLIFMGLSPQLVYEVVTMNLLYQFWLHATWIPKLGFLEYVLNTPCAHRIHHACNKEYIDGNYGGVLIVFDRLFGTYKAENKEITITYGLTQPVLSKNPVVVQFFEWKALFLDLRGSRTFKEIFGYLFKPPGWKP
jgi:sterol desaturase/sphingolipid hydroxylase (fatty acid hydroxylase superfamily)